MEQVNKNTSEDPCPVILRGSLMDFQINLSKFRHLNDASQNADRMSLPCANFCLKSKTECSTFPLQVLIFFPDLYPPHPKKDKNKNLQEFCLVSP